jgi:hypothetical protein
VAYRISVRIRGGHTRGVQDRCTPRVMTGGPRTLLSGRPHMPASEAYTCVVRLGYVRTRGVQLICTPRMLTGGACPSLLPRAVPFQSPKNCISPRAPFLSDLHRRYLAAVADPVTATVDQISSSLASSSDRPAALAHRSRSSNRRRCPHEGGCRGGDTLRPRTPHSRRRHCQSPSSCPFCPLRRHISEGSLFLPVKGTGASDPSFSCLCSAVVYIGDPSHLLFTDSNDCVY